jgi:hypothetical protein
MYCTICDCASKDKIKCNHTKRKLKFQEISTWADLEIKSQPTSKSDRDGDSMYCR